MPDSAGRIEVETPGFKEDPASTMRRHNSSVLESSSWIGLPNTTRFTDQNYQTASFNNAAIEKCVSDNNSIASESDETTTSVNRIGLAGAINIDEQTCENSHSLGDLLSISRSLPKSAIDAFFNLSSPTESMTTCEARMA